MVSSHPKSFGWSSNKVMVSVNPRFPTFFSDCAGVGSQSLKVSLIPAVEMILSAVIEEPSSKVRWLTELFLVQIFCTPQRIFRIPPSERY